MTTPERSPSTAAAPVDPDVAAALRHLYAGRVGESLRLLEQPPTAPRGRADRVLATACTIEARLARGELAVAMRAGRDLDSELDSSADDPTGDPADDPVAAVAHHSRGELAAALGDTEDALAHQLRSGRLLAGTRPTPQGPHLLPWRGSAALALVRLGRGREGLRLATEWADVAAASDSATARAHALRTLAVVGPGHDRTERLHQARALLGAHSAPRLAAQIDTDLAALLLLQHAAPTPEGRRAVQMLREIEEYAGREELHPLQARVRDLLQRAGEAPRRHHREALAMLTHTEQRIARLAADGLTNREIAARMTVTVKVVERHLSQVYRKLEIGSRTRLPAAFGLAV
ncbi:helix-turn-helix transcriptional regulator [Nocardioides ochotonae]|uniref:helix-turn-helix transcriptional regulator n=1 Tax=Nocardioides ochotonae TaxID=2685869 RepID=UPI00140A8412|nr:LuxR family transcriptional regulator [Nocardioides ochotonae]